MPSLPEALCIILQKLRTADCVADINTVLARLNRDFPGLSNNNLPATVHAALGSLIKKRKVYYTGKGYFLVSPDAASLPRLRPQLMQQRQRRRQRPSTRENAAQTDALLLMNGHTPPPPNSWSPTVMNGGGSQPATPMQAHRQLLGRVHSISPPAAFVNRHSPRSPPDLSPRLSPLSLGTVGGNPVPPLGRIVSSSSSSPNSSTDSSMNDSSSPRSQQATLERSQSLRISKKSLKQMSKGGSLRLSKKDALAVMAEGEEKGGGGREAASGESDERTSPSPKKMERKNSFLGRIFGRKKSSSGSSPTKKEILTFSAQFPPPDLDLQQHYHPPPPRHFDLQSAETQTPPHVRRKPAAVPVAVRPGLPSPPVSTRAHKNGPNGNYVVYERDYATTGRAGHPAGRPLPQSPGINYTTASEHAYESSGGSHIYSQPSLYGSNGGSNNAGSIKPPPPAYSSAPPYKPKSPPPVSQKPSLITAHSSPAPQRAVGLIASQQQRLSTLSTPVHHQRQSLTPAANQRLSPPNSNGGTMNQPQRSAMSGSPAQRPALVTSPGHKSSTPGKQVHFAATPRSNESDSPRSPPTNIRSPQILR